MSIHKMKDYRNETYHLAVNIFDRYLFLRGSKFDERYITLLAVTVILMAAKIEQPISPSMQRMVNMISDEDRQTVNKQKIIQLEDDIIPALDFEFIIPGPIPFLERFTQLMGISQQAYDNRVATELCRHLSKEQYYLQMRSSEVAAVNIILALNMTRNNDSQRQSQRVDDSARKQPCLKPLDMTCWTHSIQSTTGIGDQQIKHHLIKVAVIYQETLLPNMLAGFDAKLQPVMLPTPSQTFLQGVGLPTRSQQY